MSAAPHTARLPIILGLDAGASKTLALLAEANGRVLGRGRAGPGNYHTVGVTATYAALDAAIQAAFAEAGRPPGPVVALGLGIGGVDRPADQAVIQEWAASRYPGVPVRIVNDGLLVLAAGAPQGWGIALICGTGAIVFGCDTQGRLARAGGWGYLLGDEGGGYQISLAALRAVARAADGRGPRTSLSESILAAWSLSHPQDLIGYVYRPTVTRHHIARLAELVDQAAQQGDHIAQTIVQDAGQELALAVRSVVLQLALPAPTPCALAGSVVAQGVTVAAAFRLAAAALGLDLSPLTIVAEPAQGALKLAQGLINGVG